MATALPEFPSFDLNNEPTSLGQHWKEYLARFGNLLVALDISQPQQKRALLLHYAGTAVQDVFETLPCLKSDDQQEEEEQEEYTEAVNRLNTHFNPRKNVEYEVYVFRQARQQPGETLDQFQTRL